MTRLRRTSPDQPGWTRRRAGSGFTYLDERGKRLSVARAQRVRELVIPPAWQDVWVTPYDNGHLQAVGTDDAGRRQYLYHPQWRVRRDSAKHRRMLGFGRALSRAREQVVTDLGTSGMSLERACAVACRLLDLGYFRIGNDVYADEHGSFGLTTLQRRHVSKSAVGLRFCFVGKSGIEHTIDIEDRATVDAVEVMRRRRAAGDVELMCWKDGRTWRDLTADHVNDYLRDRTGIEATAKDFRTWHATVLAAVALAETEEPGGDQGVPEARRRRSDARGLGVPREHPDTRALVVRRPAGGRGLRGGQHHRRDRAPQAGQPRRTPGGARARRAQVVEVRLPA